MMKLNAAAIAALTLIVPSLVSVAPAPITSVASPGTLSEAPQSDEQVVWLKAHASPIRSLDPVDENYDDLEPFGRAIGEARIVFLGEAEHGGGTTYLGKTRLVKYLHERKGFDVLVFESGFFPCTKVWEAIRAGEKPMTALDLGVMRAWSWSAEIEPLAAYLGVQARARRPLEFAGFGASAIGTPRLKGVSELRAYISDLGLAHEFPEEAPLWAGFRWLETMKPLPDPTAPSREAQVQFLADLTRLRVRVGQRAQDARARFWQQTLESAGGNARWRHQLLIDSSDADWTAFSFNDEQAGRNLLWLANDRYRDRKLIVWSATMHAARNTSTIDTRGGRSYAGMVNAGQIVWNALRSASYVVGFVALGGTFRLGEESWTIKRDQQPEREMEELLGDAGFDFAFLDYRSPARGGEWLRRPFVSRPLGEQAMLARWPDVIDGIVFMREQRPATWPDFAARMKRIP